MPRVRELVTQVALAAFTALVVIWAGYRFSVGRLEDLPPMDYDGTPALAPAGQRSAFLAWFARLPLPAPEFWHGYLFLRAHDLHGHLAFLYGETREHGFRSFYLVGLALKSPLPFLALVAAAAGVAVTAFRRRGRSGLDATGTRGLGAGLAAVAALAFSAIITVNIGLRHMLIVVPLLAIFAARVLVPWIEALAPRPRAIAAAAVGLLLATNIASVERARPQLMAYFNPLAGREPGHALIDSDLDWGQDMLLLERELAARGVSEIHYGLFAIVNPCDSAMPKMIPLEPGRPVTGWIVLSEQFYRSGLHLQLPSRLMWPGRVLPVPRGSCRRVRLDQEVRARGTRGRVAPALLHAGAIVRRRAMTQRSKGSVNAVPIPEITSPTAAASLPFRRRPVRRHGRRDPLRTQRRRRGRHDPHLRALPALVAAEIEKPSTRVARSSVERLRELQRW